MSPIVGLMLGLMEVTAQSPISRGGSGKRCR